MNILTHKEKISEEDEYAYIKIGLQYMILNRNWQLYHLYSVVGSGRFVDNIVDFGILLLNNVGLGFRLGVGWVVGGINGLSF